MALSRKDELRALDADEQELVGKSHHPEVQELDDAALADLIRLVRDRRDKARAEAHRRRREMRGKASAKGARPSAADAGSRVKVEVLATAMRRLNSEASRRRALQARADHIAAAERALALRKAGEAGGGAPSGGKRTAGKGMRANPSGRREAIARPAEVGRVSQAVKKGQAKRDSR